MTVINLQQNESVTINLINLAHSAVEAAESNNRAALRLMVESMGKLLNAPKEESTVYDFPTTKTE